MLQAHDVAVRRSKKGGLTPECRAAYRAINLNFHDTRREAGSSVLENGMAPHYVEAFLDHANLSTTSRYLNVTAQGMHAALTRVEVERGVRCNSVVSRGRRERDYRIR